MEILVYFLNQVNEFLAMTDEQKTALKWQFLLERSKIYLKVSIFYSTMLFYIYKPKKILEFDQINKEFFYFNESQFPDVQKDLTTVETTEVISFFI